MKKATVNFKVLILLLIACFFIPSCEDYNQEPYDEDFIPGEALESKSMSIGLDGGTLKMEDGTKIIVPGEAMIEEFTLEVSKINPKQLFSETNSIVYDIDFSSAPLFLEIQFQLKKGLDEEDISIVSYNPKDVDVIEGIEPGFLYDPKTGYASSIVIFEDGTKSAANLKGIRHELLFTRWVVEWDENVEGKVEGLLLDMPYYMQPGGSCVSACATMLTKAYRPYKDRRVEYEIKDYLKYLGIGKDDGVGTYSFLHNLLKAFHLYTGNGVATDGFFSRRSLRSKIIEELDKAHPVILNMDYPGTGRHAILILGYEKVTSGSQQVTYNLIYHNPDLTQNMYQKNGFEWLMSSKSWTVAYQILYPTDKVHEQRALQTIGLPLNEDGFIKFLIKGKKYSVNLDYDRNATDGYSWIGANKQVHQSIPDSATSLELYLPVWNADRTGAKDIRIRTAISQEGNANSVFLEDIEISLPAGTDPYWYRKSILTTDFVQKNGQKKYSILLQIWSKSDEYLDGFLLGVNIEPTKEMKFSVNIVPLDPEGAPIDKDGKPEVEYGFEAKYEGLPADVSSLLFKWDFGDGTPVKQWDTEQQKHIFNRTGTFNIKVEVWDNIKNRKLGEDTVEAKIKGDLVIFTTNACGAGFHARYKDLLTNIESWVHLNCGGAITWTGNSFKGSKSTNSEGDTYTHAYSMEVSGSVSSDGKTLISFSGAKKSIARFKSDNKIYWHEEQAFTISNLNFPLDGSGNPGTVIKVPAGEHLSAVSVSKYVYIWYYNVDHDKMQFNREYLTVHPDFDIEVSFNKY